MGPSILLDSMLMTGASSPLPTLNLQLEVSLPDAQTISPESPISALLKINC